MRLKSPAVELDKPEETLGKPLTIIKENKMTNEVTPDKDQVKNELTEGISNMDTSLPLEKIANKVENFK